MYCPVLGDIKEPTVIANGRGIHSLGRLKAIFGGSNWHKMKGVAMVALKNGIHRHAEIHWHEAHGIGRTWLKIKRFID